MWVNTTPFSLFCWKFLEGKHTELYYSRQDEAYHADNQDPESHHQHQGVWQVECAPRCSKLFENVCSINLWLRFPSFKKSTRGQTLLLMNFCVSCFTFTIGDSSLI
jgi:hypothetical protein